MAFSLACDAGKTTLRIEGIDSDVTWNDVANAGAGSVAVDGALGVTGAATPSAANSPPPYEEYGTYNGQPYYRQLGGAFFIWWNGVDTWYISIDLGELGSGVFYRTDPSVLGIYDHTGAFGGTPTVALGTEDPSFFVTEHVANGIYQILKNIQFGDDVNALTFYSKNEMVYFVDDQIFTVKTNATLQLGEIAGNYCINGADWSWEQDGYILNDSGGTINIYSSKVSFRGSGLVRIQLGAVDFRNSIFTDVNKTGAFHPMAAISSMILKDVYFNNWSSFLCYKTPDTCEGLWIHYTGTAIMFNASAMTLLEPKVTDQTIRQVQVIGANQTLTFKNPRFTPVRGQLRIDNATSKIVSQFTCDIHIVDKDGGNLEGVTVTCEDKDSNQIFSVQTDVNGVIAQQTITYKKWEGTDETETEYSPYKFTFSKNGYTLLVMENVTVDARVNWDVEVKFPERIRARMANPGRLAILR